MAVVARQYALHSLSYHFQNATTLPLSQDAYAKAKLLRSATTEEWQTDVDDVLAVGMVSPFQLGDLQELAEWYAPKTDFWSASRIYGLVCFNYPKLISNRKSEYMKKNSFLRFQIARFLRWGGQDFFMNR